jgi:6-phosphogluconolactonase
VRDVEVYANVEELVDAIVAQAFELIRANAMTRIAVSGGSAGVKIAAGLIQRLDSNGLLDQVMLYLADERFVEVGDSMSNLGQIKSLVGDHSPSFYQFRVPPEATIDQAVAQANDELGEGFGFDLALMGCGPDGHTASLFPGHQYPNKTVVSELDSPKPPAQRISFSYEAFRASRHVWFAASGEDKATAVSQIFSGNTTLPAGIIQGSESTKWFITEELA